MTIKYTGWKYVRNWIILVSLYFPSLWLCLCLSVSVSLFLSLSAVSTCSYMYTYFLHLVKVEVHCELLSLILDHINC